jgi:hypothetical protein
MTQSVTRLVINRRRQVSASEEKSTKDDGAMILNDNVGEDGSIKTQRRG